MRGKEDNEDHQVYHIRKHNHKQQQKKRQEINAFGDISSLAPRSYDEVMNIPEFKGK
jgi:hypothetical protein